MRLQAPKNDVYHRSEKQKIFTLKIFFTMGPMDENVIFKN